MSTASEILYYEYRIKSGDTFSGILHRMFGRTSSYAEMAGHVLALNPQISNPDAIRAGDMLRLAELPASSQPKPAIKTFMKTRVHPRPSQIKPPTFVTQAVHPHDAEEFWALAWLEHNANFLTIPGSMILGSSGNLLSPGNVGLINDVSDQYAKYKSGKITKAQYDYRRKKSLDQLKRNIGPIEKLLFGQNTTHESIRIARAGGVPATAHIAKHVDRLKILSNMSKAGGFVLVGVGLTSACMQIASTTDIKEKNIIFVETITNTTLGTFGGYIVGLFLVSNPIGWGAAIVLAVGTTAAA